MGKAGLGRGGSMSVTQLHLSLWGVHVSYGKFDPFGNSFSKIVVVLFLGELKRVRQFILPGDYNGQYYTVHMKVAM